MNTSPLHIDNINFAKKAEHVSGQINIANCPRLAEILQSQKPTRATSKPHDSIPSAINFELRGEVDTQGRCFIHMAVEANLQSYCQRCLEPLLLPLKLNFSYLIAEADEQASGELSFDDVDEYDLQEPDKAMDLQALIEDELIMALPIAPTHDDDCVNLISQSGEKPNPFAVLKDLIKS
jgi:uncharacterized protein